MATAYSMSTFSGAITVGALIESLLSSEVQSLNFTPVGDLSTMKKTANGGSVVSLMISDQWELSVTYLQTSAFFDFVHKLKILHNTPVANVLATRSSSISVVDLSTGSTFVGDTVALKSGTDVPVEGEAKELTTVFNIGKGTYTIGVGTLGGLL